MENTPLFSVILLHYNQPQYVKTAIDSILTQDYSDIELIFADDASKVIDVDDLKKYIDENRKENLKNVIWQINPNNLGTVKSLNLAVKKCTGKYILFFAADDALYNKKVISNFVHSLEKAPGDVYMISAQCHMMDSELLKDTGSFVNPSEGAAFNNKTAQQQFAVFANNCFLAIGATAMKAEMFNTFGAFDERYTLVEDWAYYLKLTRSGGRILYADFDALLHRDGGVSHYNQTGIVPEHVKKYKYDIASIFENEIMPYMKGFSLNDKYVALERYKYFRRDYKESGGERALLPMTVFVKKYPMLFLRKGISVILQESFKAAKTCCKLLISLLIIWGSLSIVALTSSGLSAFGGTSVALKLLPFIISLIQNILPVAIIVFAVFTLLFVIAALLYKIRRSLKG